MAGLLTRTGTFTTWTSNPTDHGQSIHQADLGQDEMRARDGVSRDQEGFQELNNVIAIYAEENSVAPMAAIHRLHDMLGQMMRQRTDGAERVYTP